MLIFPRNCRLGQRQVALIELGMIQSSDDLPTFAQNLYVCLAFISVKAAC